MSLHECGYPGCHTLTSNTYCHDHRISTSEYDTRRGTAAQRGYGYRWQHARSIWLHAHPLCAECTNLGLSTVATVVDHITPHRGDIRLFWDKSNWQSLCKACHDDKTKRETKLIEHTKYKNEVDKFFRRG